MHIYLFFFFFFQLTSASINDNEFLGLNSSRSEQLPKVLLDLTVTASVASSK